MTICVCCSIHGMCSYTFIHHKHIERLFHSICIQRFSYCIKYDFEIQSQHSDSLVADMWKVSHTSRQPPDQIDIFHTFPIYVITAVNSCDSCVMVQISYNNGYHYLIWL